MSDEEFKDRLAIADRLAICAQAGDARKADLYAGCFTEQGVLDLAEPIGPIVGREAIRAWMSDRPVPLEPAARAAPVFISHHLTTCRIELTGPGTAAARTYWLVTSPAGLDHNGYYDDRLEKVGGTWLLAHRRPRTLWMSETSVVRR